MNEDRVIDRIVKEHNKQEKELAEQEGRNHSLYLTFRFIIYAIPSAQDSVRTKPI